MRSTRSRLILALAMSTAMDFVIAFVFLFGISMECRLKQRAAIKKCVRAGESVKSTIQKLQSAWHDHALSVSQIRFWFRRFTIDPQRDTKDSAHTGRLVSQRTPRKTQAVQRQLQEDKQKTVCQLAHECWMGKTTAHVILKKDLKLKKLAPKFVTKILTDHQKDVRLRISQDNVRKIENDPGILARLVATDKSWIFTYDPRSKFADMQWTAAGEPRLTKALRGRSRRKTMLILYFDSHGPLLCYFHDDGTVDSDIYIESLRQLCEAIRRKRPELWKDKSFILLQDNASPHTSLPTADFLFQVDMAESLWPHPQYSPDLSPCDFWAFPILKSLIRGHRFESLEDVKTTVQRTLKEIPLSEYQDCFDKLLLRYKKCVQAGGNYFEGQGKRGLGQVE